MEITYCSNIHAGETWKQIFFNLQTYALQVKKAVSADRLFPLGLRLSFQATQEIQNRDAVLFLDWCQENNCYVPTINGFPYGVFHNTPIKEKVYLPDWRDKKRVEYTKKLISLLDFWLPKNQTGSISTVPIAFKKGFEKKDFFLVHKNLFSVLEYMDKISQVSGKKIVLCLEPEPGCVLETSYETAQFFEKMNFPPHLKKIIGVCFDCCHQAVEFENASRSLSLLLDADIPIGKIQISAACCFQHPTLELLQSFCEPYYLHQVFIQKNNALTFYPDLAVALALHPPQPSEEWRVHFHVPIFLNTLEFFSNQFCTSQFFICDLLPCLDFDVLLEVETYTWDVLPSQYKLPSVTESIIREIIWLSTMR